MRVYVCVCMYVYVCVCTESELKLFNEISVEVCVRKISTKKISTKDTHHKR